LACQAEAARRWRLKDPARYARAKTRTVEERRARAAANNEYNEKAKLRMREYYRKKLGIPPASRPEPANCECCGRVMLPGRRTHLDHCHTTGIFRGWLCNRCNMGLGNLGDSVEGVEKALAYLRRAYKL